MFRKFYKKEILSFFFLSFFNFKDLIGFIQPFMNLAATNLIDKKELTTHSFFYSFVI